MTWSGHVHAGWNSEMCCECHATVSYFSNWNDRMVVLSWSLTLFLPVKQFLCDVVCMLFPFTVTLLHYLHAPLPLHTLKLPLSLRRIQTHFWRCRNSATCFPHIKGRHLASVKVGKHLFFKFRQHKWTVTTRNVYTKDQFLVVAVFHTLSTSKLGSMSHQLAETEVLLSQTCILIW